MQQISIQRIVRAAFKCYVNINDFGSFIIWFQFNTFKSKIDYANTICQFLTTDN